MSKRKASDNPADAAVAETVLSVEIKRADPDQKESLQWRLPAFVDASNYSLWCTQLQSYQDQLMERFDKWLCYVAEVSGKYAHVTTFEIQASNDSKALADYLAAKQDKLAAGGEGLLVGQCRQAEFEKRVNNEHFRNDLDIGWYRGTHVKRLENIPTAAYFQTYHRVYGCRDDMDKVLTSCYEWEKAGRAIESEEEEEEEEEAQKPTTTT